MAANLASQVDSDGSRTGQIHHRHRTWSLAECGPGMRLITWRLASERPSQPDAPDKSHSPTHVRSHRRRAKPSGERYAHGITAYTCARFRPMQGDGSTAAFQPLPASASCSCAAGGSKADEAIAGREECKKSGPPSGLNIPPCKSC